MSTIHALFWNAYAVCYDTLFWLEPYRKMLDDVAGSIPINRGTILNAGCGTGNLERVILASHPDIKVKGLDFSPIMIERARRKCSDGRAVFEQGNLDNPLAFENESFDGVISVNCMYALPRPGFTLDELRRVLKTEGWLVIADPRAGASMKRVFHQHIVRGGSEPAFHWIGRMVQTIVMLPALLVVGVINARIESRERRGHYLFRSSEEWRQLLEEHGWRIERIQPTYGGEALLIVSRPSMKTTE